MDFKRTLDMAWWAIATTWSVVIFGLILLAAIRGGWAWTTGMSFNSYMEGPVELLMSGFAALWSFPFFFRRFVRGRHG